MSATNQKLILVTLYDVHQNSEEVDESHNTEMHELRDCLYIKTHANDRASINNFIQSTRIQNESWKIESA